MMRRTPRHLHFRHRMQVFVAFVFLLTSLLPGPVLAAGVHLYARPDMGVSRLPLQVMAFDAPGFGELAEAINLASGNVYLSVDSLSANSVTDAAQGTVPDVFAEAGWSANPKLRLSGFSQGVETAPAAFTLLQGDGSVASFERRLPAVNTSGGSLQCGTGLSFDMRKAPSWIQRYSAGACDVAFYRLVAEAGLGYAEAWVVLLVGESTQPSIAHYYAHDGTRFTFYGDGEFADYQQDLHQQYVSASQHASPEGLNGPKTQFTYQDAVAGRLTRVEDAWGRVTVYSWADRYGARVVDSIDYLRSGGSSSWVRQVKLTYRQPADITGVILKTVTFYARPGDSGTATSRSLSFDYDHNPTRLSRVARTVAGGGTVDNRYFYDGLGRVNLVTEQVSGGSTERMRTAYAYSASGSAFGGMLVTVTKSAAAGLLGQAQVSMYHFDGQGRLRRKVANEARPDGVAAARDLVWNYTYYNNGNLGLLQEPSGRVTHYTYDLAGNLSGEAVYAAMANFGQRQPAQVSVVQRSPDRSHIGFEETFSLTVEVSRDELMSGVEWLYLDGSGNAIAFVEGQAGAPITLTQTATAPAGASTYQVTATFLAPAVAKHVTVRARSRRDPGSHADIPLHVESPILGITLINVPKSLIVAPGCVRHPGQVGAKISTCDQTYQLAAEVALMTGYTGPESKYRALSFSVVGTNNLAGLVTPSISSSGDLKVSYHNYADPLPSNTRTVKVRAKSVAVPAQVSADATINLGFFGLKRVNGTGTKGDWGATDELADGSHYQFQVAVYNSPVPSENINIHWWTTRTSGSGDIGAFSADNGCLQTINVSPGGGIEGTIHARVYGFSDQFASVNVSQWAKVHYIIWGEFGEGCGGTEMLSSGVVPGGLQDLDPIVPQAVQVPPVSLVVAQTTELTNEHQVGSVYYREYDYDVDNRMTRASTPVDELDRVTVLGDVTDIYQEVCEDVVYASHPVTQVASPWFAAETFGATKTVTRTTRVGGCGIGTALRSVTDSLGADGLLLSSSTNWADAGAGGLTNARTTTYTYYGAGVTMTAAGVDGASFDILQYGDRVRSAVVTSNVAPVVAGSVAAVTREFIYDRLGNLVQEKTLAGAVVGVDAATGPTLVDHTVQRQFNTYGQQVWERVLLGQQIASEQRWTFLGTGELAHHWQRQDAGTAAGRLTTFTYGSGLEAARLVRERSGPGTADGTLSAVRSDATYVYDAFGRVSARTQHVDASTASTTQYAYDTLDRVVTTTLPSGARTTTTYDVHGQVSQEVVGDDAGHTLVTHAWTRDSLGYLVDEAITPAPGKGAGYSVAYTNDPFGRVVGAVTSNAAIGQSPADRTTAYRYDSEGKLLFEVGPKLRTTADAHALMDHRRPAVAYRYDGLGQRVREERILDGRLDLGSGTPVSLDGGPSAVTLVAYDGFGRAMSVTDPEGYITLTAFDALGQAFRVRRQVTLNGSDYADIWTAYDSTGHATEVIEPSGAGEPELVVRHEYDLLGNVLADVNEAGYRIKEYSYTPDGLLASVSEPSLSAGAGTVQAPGSAARVLTQVNTYDRQEPYPSRVYRAWMDSAPQASGSGNNYIDYTYDAAGRVTDMSYSDGSAVQQAYDAYGSLVTLQDRDGYTTTYTYDYAGHPLSEQLQALSADQSSGLGAGLTTTSIYDAYGNLVQQTRRGLTTDFAYNSLGLVIAESRPHDTSVSAPPFKKYAYRLDGRRTAETTFDYQDAGDSNSLELLQQRGIRDSNPLPNFGASGAGGVKTFIYDLLGNLAQEQSFGYFQPGGGRNEMHASYTYNGLGQRLTRNFEQGDSSVYAPQRDTTGRFLMDAGQSDFITAYTTHYTYDLRGNLLHAHDEVVGPSGNTTRNSFDYSYSPTGKV